jgi:hypothetical protein
MGESLYSDIRRIAEEEGADPDLAIRVAKQESNLGRNTGPSRAGAVGTMQVLPSTGREMGLDVNDPMQNIRAGVRYLAQQQRDFGDPSLAAAAYNAGPGRVREFQRSGRPLPQETQAYTRSMFGAAPQVEVAPIGEAAFAAAGPRQGPILQEQARARGAMTDAATEEARLTGEKSQALATGQREVAERNVEEQRAALQAYQAQRQMPDKFEPTQENAGDLSALFGLIGVFGTLLGGGGKRNAINAMNAMTGMMSGWRQGRQDLYNREKQVYETNLRQLETRNNELRRDLDSALRISQTNMEAGLAKVRELAARYDVPILMAQAKKNDINGIIQTYDSIRQVAGQLDQHDRTLAAQTARQQAQRQDELVRFVRQQGGETLALFDQTGIALPRQSAEKIMNAGRSVGEALSLIDEVNKHPEYVGRSGQVRAFFDRYVSSVTEAMRTNATIPSAELQGAERELSEADQRALLFQKRYASYLVNYERSLAGGARGFTVSFQQRFNRLMAQEQFTPAGLNRLLKEQIDEVTAGAAIPGIPQFERNGIVALGIDLVRRGTGPERAGTAESGFKYAYPNQPVPRLQRPGTAAATPAPTEGVREVASEQEAEGLPAGTRFRLPDGRTGTVR